MYKVNWCWACDYCGREKEFENKHEAIAFFKAIRPYASHIHFGDMPEGLGVGNFVNARCEYEGCVGSYKLANLIQKLFYKAEEVDDE